MMTPVERLVLLALAAMALMALAAWILYRVRRTPAERERRRCDLVNRAGRMADGMVTDVGDGIVFYTYSVMGVEYTTSQDVSALEGLLPDNRNSLIGPATLKYLPRNPANSILMCEDWSGLRNEPVAAEKKFAVGS